MPVAEYRSQQEATHMPGRKPDSKPKAFFSAASEWTCSATVGPPAMPSWMNFCGSRVEPLKCRVAAALALAMLSTLADAAAEGDSASVVETVIVVGVAPLP